jgi:Domain of unknown function (DUF4386)
LFATLTNMVQTAVLVVNKLNLLVPLFLLEDAGYLKIFSAEQLHTLSSLAISAHAYGFALGLLFFGFACVATGQLIYRSGFLPKILGILMWFAGLSYLPNSFALLLAPSFAAAIFPAVLVPAFVSELSVALWLLVKGVDMAQWPKRGAT